MTTRTVLCNFNDASFDYFGVHSRFSEKTEDTLHMVSQPLRGATA